LAGIPTFFIESFRIPPFLLPIFQAAGTAYGVPWQILAAINEVETDYGRDLSVSSAGAEGWMQFLPPSWAVYGVDANGDGFQDPYNPADAIFAAARYLRAAGATTDLRGAIFAYNHSRAYVESVLLRARLLGGTPTELLGALTGLTQARFPVHAASHFSDGFPPSPAGSGPPRTLAGTTIYSQTGAPVIAVQDGRISRIGRTPELGRFISLRDAYGNTYTYAQLGWIARFYPVLQPHEGSGASPSAKSREAAESPPKAPASAGVQPRAQAPLVESPALSGLAPGAPAGAQSPVSLGGSPTSAQPAPAAGASSAPPTTSQADPATTPTAFRAGPNDVYLHPLRAGVLVIAGTVLGHVGASGAAGQAGEADPHVLFQIRPAGAGAPLIDPKPILDGWVQLENTSIYRAGGANPYLATEPSPGQVLLESKQQLEQQVLADHAITMARCGREDVQTGKVDRRVLAVVEFLAVSGLRPTVSGLECATPGAGGEGSPSAQLSAEALDISAINGVPVSGHQGTGSITDTTIRKLLALQGPLRPRQIVSLMRYPDAHNTLAMADHRGRIHVSFAQPLTAPGRIASAFGAGITPTQWIELIARLGEIPSPTVRGGPSAASIPDHPALTGANAGAAGGNG
jgi:murein DD-endopeptidase MepM/ murein hydrolase activator NlpD